MVGDSFAGKTSVVYRMVNSDRALPDYIPTVMKTEPVRCVNDGRDKIFKQFYISVLLLMERGWSSWCGTPQVRRTMIGNNL